MKDKQAKFDKLSEMAAIDGGRLTEDEARAILEGIRWPKATVCSHCGSKKVTRIQVSYAKIHLTAESDVLRGRGRVYRIKTDGGVKK